MGRRRGRLTEKLVAPRVTRDSLQRDLLKGNCPLQECQLSLTVCKQEMYPPKMLLSGS